MKVVIIFLLFGCAVAANYERDEPVQYTDTRDSTAQFSLRFLTKDGTDVTKQGVLKPNNKGDDFVLHQTGRVAYFDPQGGRHEYKYFADDKGYHVEDPDIPKQVVAQPPTF